jgi:hypothetical protein
MSTFKPHCQAESPSFREKVHSTPVSDRKNTFRIPVSDRKYTFQTLVSGRKCTFQIQFQTKCTPVSGRKSTFKPSFWQKVYFLISGPVSRGKLSRLRLQTRNCGLKMWIHRAHEWFESGLKTRYPALGLKVDILHETWLRKWIYSCPCAVQRLFS